MEKEITKKLCFVQPRAYYLFNPKADNFADKIGGAQKQSYLYSIELAKHKKFDVHFITANFGQSDLEVIDNVKVWKSFNFQDNILKKTLDLFQILKKIDANICIFRSADIGVAIAIFYIKLFLRKKVLYMIAGDAEVSFKQLKQKSGFLTALAMPFVYKYADFISAQSQTQSALFAKYRKRKPDIVLRNIINLPETAQNKKKQEILWMGRLDKIKNPELFIELAKKYPNEQFVMIAPIVQDFVEYGENIKNKAAQTDNLKYIDYVLPNKTDEYYQKAKIYVISSFSEGFSNTMAEAMANNVPVLSYNVNPDNIFDRYKIGYCAEGNKDKFFEQFESLLNNHWLSEKLGNNGRIYLEKNHNKAVIIKKITDILTND